MSRKSSDIPMESGHYGINAIVTTFSQVFSKYVVIAWKTNIFSQVILSLFMQWLYHTTHSSADTKGFFIQTVCYYILSQLQLGSFLDRFRNIFERVGAIQYIIWWKDV